MTTRCYKATTVLGKHCSAIQLQIPSIFTPGCTITWHPVSVPARITYIPHLYRRAHAGLSYAVYTGILRVILMRVVGIPEVASTSVLMDYR